MRRGVVPPLHMKIIVMFTILAVDHTKEKPGLSTGMKMVVGEGFEPSKTEVVRFTV